MICCTNCWCLKLSDIISILMFGITVFIFVVAWKQWRLFRKSQLLEFTHRVYMDIFNFLNEERNRDLKDWLFGRKEFKDKKERLGDLFEKFEAVYSLMKRKLIDDEMFYDLIGYYIEMSNSKENKPKAADYIKFARDEAKKKGVIKTDDIFIGFYRMLEKIQKISFERNGKDESLA